LRPKKSDAPVRAVLVDQREAAERVAERPAALPRAREVVKREKQERVAGDGC